MRAQKGIDPGAKLVRIILLVLVGLSLATAGCATASPPAPLTVSESPDAAAPNSGDATGLAAETSAAVLTEESTAAPITPQATAAVAEPPPTETPLPISEPAVIFNPGFEEGKKDGELAGRANFGAAEDSILEDRGHPGDFRLTHGGANAYQLQTLDPVK